MHLEDALDQIENPVVRDSAARIGGGSSEAGPAPQAPCGGCYRPSTGGVNVSRRPRAPMDTPAPEALQWRLARRPGAGAAALYIRKRVFMARTLLDKVWEAHT